MNLIFDFDGTICNSMQDSVKTINVFLKANSLPLVTIPELRDQGMKGLVQRRHVPLTKIPELVATGNREIAKYVPTQKTFPGLTAVLRELARTNFLAIITSNTRDNVNLFLKNNNLEGIFQAVNSDFSLFGKAAKVKQLLTKYRLDPRETYLIGDETRDVEGAKKAGVGSVAVTWGYESRASLQQSRPDLIISAAAGLLKLKTP